jgi:hypothetical protein
MRAVPRLCELYPDICHTTEEKTRKNLSQGSRRVPAGMMKTEYTEQRTHKIKIHKYSGASDSSMYPGDDLVSKNEYQDIPGGKDGRCVRVTTLPPSCAECLEILQP